MKCKFCKDDIRAWDTKRKGYIIVTKHIDNSFHVHGTLKNTNLARELVRAIIHEAKLTHLFMEASSEKEDSGNLPDSV